MKIIIQLSAREEAKAIPVLLRHSPGMVLKDRTYVIDREALAALRKARIKFIELGRDSGHPITEGSMPGERI